MRNDNRVNAHKMFRKASLNIQRKVSFAEYGWISTQAFHSSLAKASPTKNVQT